MNTFTSFNFGNPTPATNNATTMSFGTPFAFVANATTMSFAMPAPATAFSCCTVPAVNVNLFDANSSTWACTTTTNISFGTFSFDANAAATPVAPSITIESANTAIQPLKEMNFQNAIPHCTNCLQKVSNLVYEIDIFIYKFFSLNSCMHTMCSECALMSKSCALCATSIDKSVVENSVSESMIPTATNQIECNRGKKCASKECAKWTCTKCKRNVCDADKEWHEWICEEDNAELVPISMALKMQYYAVLDKCKQVQPDLSHLCAQVVHAQKNMAIVCRLEL